MEKVTLQQKSKCTLTIGDVEYSYYSLPQLEDKRVSSIPFSIRVLLESALRNYDDFTIKENDIEKILDWQVNAPKGVEIPFKPARVILQDLTGVPAVVDLAAMRDAIVKLGGKPEDINPACPVDLVIDHSVQVDVARKKNAYIKNQEIEFKRNYERFEFLKWGSTAFNNLSIVPPGSGIVHQVNLEYLARVVFDTNNVLYPDSLVGTDSHTTMINGLGCVGWGVGGIEAEAVMLGQNISMVLPEVVGFKLSNKINEGVTGTDTILYITQCLRKIGVVGKFIEFFGEGVQSLSLPDRATIANMAPEYGATMGFFPVDAVTLDYLRLSGRDDARVEWVEKYLRAQNLFRLYDGSQETPAYSRVIELDLSTVEPTLSGPKLPHDRVGMKNMKKDWNQCLTAPVSNKGFGLKQEDLGNQGKFEYEGVEYTLKHGDVCIAAITSCTNTSNPMVMLAAGQVAKKAVERGLTVAPYIKTSLSPGSKVVIEYLEAAGYLPYLQKLGFNVSGFGCQTCIGNSGDLDEKIKECITDNNILITSVLSGNRNFEGRIHALSSGQFLASPPYVVMYALMGTVDFDWENEPLGQDQEGVDVFLKDIWFNSEEIAEIQQKCVTSKMFKDVYSKISQGTETWNSIPTTTDKVFKWKSDSTYIHNPPFFDSVKSTDLPEITNIENAHVLLNLGDAITTDHISPAGSIAKKSPAGRYLMEKGIKKRMFNTYGSRRGNDLVMARGTFANVRLVNKMADRTGNWTKHIPSGKQMHVFDAAMEYKKANKQMIVLGGTLYGNGSSRDWAAKGPFLLGVSAVIAKSFERIHRSNLLGMGILPLQFKDGQGNDELGIDGSEQFSIDLNKGDLSVGQMLQVKYKSGDEEKTIEVKVRLDTQPEVLFWQNGGILNYVLREMAKAQE